jgi:hypothetical protein
MKWIFEMDGVGADVADDGDARLLGLRYTMGIKSVSSVGGSM